MDDPPVQLSLCRVLCLSDPVARAAAEDQSFCMAFAFTSNSANMQQLRAPHAHITPVFCWIE